MSQTSNARPVDRRTFLRNATGAGAALAALCSGTPLRAALRATGEPDLREQAGLQLFTVRDQTARDFPGTLLRVAQIGYREVQTTGSYGQYTARQIREFLDAAGLRAPTTHVNPPLGPDFERTLEGYQLIGHRYTTLRLGGARGPGGGRGPGGAAPGAGGTPAAAPRVGNEMSALPPSMTRLQTLDSVKRTAEQLNEAGRITKRYGIKVMIHNHTNEFRTLADDPRTEYDVLLAETDPELVAMELDIGWATAAGQDALEMFRANPGRYEVWHVKDLADLAALSGLTDQIERMRAARIVPLGEGEIDYRPIFAAARLAGMRYFYVEQDSAPQSGDSIAEAAKSYRGLLELIG